jgi:hypothetical protein
MLKRVVEKKTGGKRTEKEQRDTRRLKGIEKFPFILARQSLKVVSSEN